MSQIDPVVFGHRLRHYRRRRGLTLEELGQVIGRPAPFLSLVENGKREPKLSQISALANALEVDMSELLEPEAPNRRARLEIELERAQSHPRYEELGLPYLKATAKLTDEALEHIVTLFSELVETAPAASAGADDLRRANGELTRWLRRRDGYLPEIEDAARSALEACEYTGPGPLTSRHLGEIADHFGYKIRPVDDVPVSVRAIVDHDTRRIYVAQRNELRTRQARKAVLQTLGSLALGMHSPRSPLELLRQRLETAYFAAAVLVPESAVIPFLRDARNERDISIEDIKEQFYVSYEMAAQRFTNMATRHFGIACHFLRSDEQGTIFKAYANDGLPVPADESGGSEGLRLCRKWGARAAFDSEDKFDIHYQFTDTPNGSFWCATHISPDHAGHGFTVGVRFEDARVFRGRNTSRQLVSSCPDGSCCKQAPEDLGRRWDGRLEVHPRLQERLLGLLSTDIANPIETTSLYEFAEKHASDPLNQTPSNDGDLE